MRSSRYTIMYCCAVSSANIVRAPTPLATLTLTIPTQGTAFSATVPGCDADGTSVDPFAVVGIPNGTFYPGTQTYYVPPQVTPQSSTFVNYQLNATEVIEIIPLEGTCAPFAPSETATGSEPAGSEPTGGPDSGNPEDACPLEGCSKLVNQGARKIIDALNQVTILSQTLQAAARSIGLKRDTNTRLVARASLTDLLQGLRSVPPSLTLLIPYIQYVLPHRQELNSPLIFHDTNNSTFFSETLHPSPQGVTRTRL